MKGKKAVRGFAGAGLCAAGILLVLSMPREARRTFRIDAGGCRLVTDIVEPAGGGPQGYVLLLHGLSANKRVMSYWTQGFASQGLRVFVPDLPGHGRTGGPFSFDRADQCSDNLLQELVMRGLLDPSRTILAGHSMGGAIALRVASRHPVAGVVAVSPAPLRPVPGFPPEVMPFHDFGKMPDRSLVMNGAWEPGGMDKAAENLVASVNDGTNQYVSIPRATHVSILFDSKAMIDAENWANNVLHIERGQALPSHRSVIGFLLGLAGIITLAGPFLREILEDKERVEQPLEKTSRVSKSLIFLEYAIIALGVVVLLHYWIPLRVLRLFEGDYFASLLLVLGIVLLTLNWNLLQEAFGGIEDEKSRSRKRYIPILVAAFAAVLVCLLCGAWLDLSFLETWPTAGRLARFVPFLIAVTPYHLAEELLLGAVNPRKKLTRLVLALLLRLVVWSAIVAGIFLLHSGEIMPVILAGSFGLFCLGQRCGMDVVREVTASASASAVFGAILLAGFCLVVFPTT